MGVNEQSNPGGFATPNHFEGFDNSFRMDISDMQQLCEDVEKMMLERKFEARGWKRIASTWTDSTEKIITMLSSEAGEREYGVIFPGLVRGSFLLSTVGLFDRYLSLVCTQSYKTVNGKCSGSIGKTKLTQALNNGVRMKLTFLEENVGLSLSNPLSVPLHLILKVRNAFAHSAGVLDSTKAGKLLALKHLVEEEGFGDSRLNRFKLDEIGTSSHAIAIDEFFIFGVLKEMTETFVGILEMLNAKLASDAT